MGFLSKVKNRIYRQLHHANAPLLRLAERQLLLQALYAAKQNRAVVNMDGLHEAEFCAYSQWGEDGVIDWLIENLPGIPHLFVEFGVEDYRESNTRLLLQLRNWRGLVLDGSSAHISDIRSQEIYWRYGITANCAFIDRDNINHLLTDAGLTGDIGLLSIDIDGNDYWVWEAINVVNPAIVVCEYNAVLGDRHALTIPYQADFQRTKAHHSNLYFGASIQALVSLGKRKGYTFVGTTSTGCNAFFVRNDLASSIVDKLDGIWAFPSAVREARDEQGHLLFKNGHERALLIQDLALQDVELDSMTSLAVCEDIYSAQWNRSEKVGI